MDEIEPIMCTPPPFELDDKVFYVNDKDGNQVGEPFSYNDWIKYIKDISGITPELCEESRRVQGLLNYLREA